MKVKPIKFGSTDKYFGIGIIEKSEVENPKHGNYVCYPHRKAKTVDMRYTSILGYNEGHVGSKNSGWENYNSSNYEITFLLDFRSNQLKILLDGGQAIVRDIHNPSVDYVFVFDPYYQGTKFSVEFI